MAVSPRSIFVGLVTAATTAACATTQTTPATPDPLAAGWKGKPVCERLHEDAQQRVLRCSFPPGVGHERHFHAPHFGYALSGGQMQLTDASGVRKASLSTDSHFISDGTNWHEVLNIGDAPVIYLIIEPK